ncbi:MAG: cyclopropane-fatty-acyl-phospholipid synthase family protein, partial [Ramlibacter sp.]
MQQKDRQLQAARRIVEHIAVRLGADLGVRLWDASVIPLGIGARSDILIAVNTPDVFRRLLLAPRLMTLFELYARGAIAIEGGTPLEAVRRWDHIKAVGLGKTIDKWLVLKSLWPFLRGGDPGAQASTHAYGGAIARRHEAGRDDRDLIQFHYDVSNSFYALFLDPEMVYSPAYFARQDMSLEEAQVAKLDRICRRLRLQPGEHLLDIGCGWGGLVCHAARYYGVSALGVTLSQQQYDSAQQKIRSLGLHDRVTVELRDFRSVTQPDAFDAVAQIGMFEHLGIDNHDGYFALIHRILKPRGRYLHDAITRRPT